MLSDPWMSPYLSLKNNQVLIQDFAMGEAKTKMEGTFVARVSSQDATLMPADASKLRALFK